jgi:glucose/arabinose dehydrogenase
MSRLAYASVVVGRPLPTLLVAALLLLAAGRAHAGAATLPTGFSDTAMASSLNTPTGLAEIPDPPSAPGRRVLFVEQPTARVALLVGGSVYTVGTVPSVTFGSERGLLGIAVDPGWPARPYIYVHSTDNRSGNKVSISRFTLTGDLDYSGNGQVVFNAASRYDLRANFPDNASNHNGGTVRFGADGMLYVSLGDDATGCPAQDLTVAAGKILRLDVSQLPPTGTGPAPYGLLAPADNPWIANTDSTAQLVYSVGLRNPFRFNIDPATNALVIGDVGEVSWEEVDLVTAGGMDLGWPIYEAEEAHASCVQTPPAPLTGPIAYYDHPTGYAIIGGPRYRRPSTGSMRLPTEYEGDVFFLDYYSGLMRRVKLTGGTWAPAPAPGQPSASNWGTGLGNVSDMIELSDGTLWYCRQTQGGASTGEIRRIGYTGSASVPPPSQSALALSPPSPNPARGGAVLAWTQPGDARVTLAIYATDGHRVRTLADAERWLAGPHQRTWDGLDEAGRRAPAGVYFVRLEVNGEARGARLTLLR